MTRKTKLLGTTVAVAPKSPPPAASSRQRQKTPTIYLPRADAAKQIGCSVRHMERLAQFGGGPPFLMHGSRAVYPLDELDAWARARLRTTSPASADRQPA